ncbi:uncharacterized protein LOC115627626 [Scaptodrosophila lebanonensis]|uniref:Uncharacterized protein LOC115627626 n=1 Tax=Drosophila lebanonensis TaxID=7225 RepID=A0A6J2TWF4_DROLE|nr:uncharacterized protein LOC115627626 [Scaptodrosophila lebanonensis]
MEKLIAGVNRCLIYQRQLSQHLAELDRIMEDSFFENPQKSFVKHRQWLRMQPPPSGMISSRTAPAAPNPKKRAASPMTASVRSGNASLREISSAKIAANRLLGKLSSCQMRFRQAYGLGMRCCASQASAAFNANKEQNLLGELEMDEDEQSLEDAVEKNLKMTRAIWELLQSDKPRKHNKCVANSGVHLDLLKKHHHLLPQKNPTTTAVRVPPSPYLPAAPPPPAPTPASTPNQTRKIRSFVATNARLALPKSTELLRPTKTAVQGHGLSTMSRLSASCRSCNFWRV